MENRDHTENRNEIAPEKKDQNVDRKIREGAGSDMPDTQNAGLKKSDLPDNDNNEVGGMGSGQRQDSN